jgi:group I intron endonuclease
MKQFIKENLPENNLIGIYLIKNNITNKHYVGQSLELKTRLNKHLSNYKVKSKKNSYPLYISINKYGIEEFTFDILFSEEKDINRIQDQRNLLNTLEKKYILEYNSYGNSGYNQTLGSTLGTYGYKFTEEQKENLSNAQKNVAEEQDLELFVYDIDSTKEYVFKNSIKFKKHFNIEEGYKVRRTYHKRNESEFSIAKDKYLVANSKEELKNQIENLKNLNYTRGRFQEISQNIYCYNYILKSYYTFCSLSKAQKSLNKEPQFIFNAIKRKSRSDDGWIIAKTKEDLEEIKLSKTPSARVIRRYKTLNVTISTYPHLSIIIQ